MHFDLSLGRTTKALILLDDGRVVSCALTPRTIGARIDAITGDGGGEGEDQGEIQGENEEENEESEGESVEEIDSETDDENEGENENEDH